MTCGKIDECSYAVIHLQQLCVEQKFVLSVVCKVKRSSKC